MSKEQERKARFTQYEIILCTAHDAAARAQAGMVENPKALDCGFAWVVVHHAAFARWCRKRVAEGGAAAHYGRKPSASGWSFWCPGGACVQAISIHEAGARAFRDVLAHGLQCVVDFGSRLD